MRRLLRGGYYSEARDAVWDVTQSLRLPYYFWLGCRGFLAAMAWLIIPVSLLAWAALPDRSRRRVAWLAGASARRRAALFALLAIAPGR